MQSPAAEPDNCNDYSTAVFDSFFYLFCTFCHKKKTLKRFLKRDT